MLNIKSINYRYYPDISAVKGRYSAIVAALPKNKKPGRCARVYHVSFYKLIVYVR